MYRAALILFLLGVSHIHCVPVAPAGDAGSNVDAAADSSDASADGLAPRAGSTSAVKAQSLQGQVLPADADAIPVPSSSGGQQGGAAGGSLQRPDTVGDYLAQIRRPALRMTVDSVNEGYKKKNRNTFEDASIKIHNKNNSDFTRTGQVQSFEGPGFKMRTAVLTENNNGKIKTAVVTAQESEKNYTRSKDRLTQFVGTLDTDQFSSGALLTDHSNRAVIGSVRLQADGNREQRLQKKTADDLVRGSFLKTANLSINARYQSNGFSDRQRLISDIVLGGGSDSPAGGSAGAPAAGSSSSGGAAAPPAASAAAGDDQDDS